MSLSHASDQSDSSSVVYQHESFTTFSSRVLDLAATLWPDSDPHEFCVERLSGGGFHRIIGLTRRTTATCAGNGETHFIVRIPRFESAKVDDEVAALYFAGRLGIPVPTVIAFDKTAENALGLPYMMQNRIVGTDLYSCFPTLPHSQQLQIARELGSIFRQMLEVRSSIGGRVVLGDGEKGATCIAPMRWKKDSDSNTEQQQTPPQQSPCQWLSALFVAKHATDPSDTLWADFDQMAHELDAGGWFSQVWYSLAHLDLAPRNILIDKAAFLENLAYVRPMITAILDWDGAVLAPCFLSCYPPLWLWGWRDDEDEDERTANDDPGTAQGRQLKMQFEEAAGTDYVHFAYGAPYRLARRLVRFAIDGVRSNEDYKEAKAMLCEWAHVCVLAEGGVKGGG